MKKRLWIFTLVCVLLSCMLVLASCGENDTPTETTAGGNTTGPEETAPPTLDVETVEKDTLLVLGEALQNATNAVLPANPARDAIMEQAMTGGSFHAYVEGKDLLDAMGLGMDKIDYKAFFNAKEGKLVSDARFTVQNQEVAGQIFLDKNGLIAKGGFFFAEDQNAYLVNLDTLIKNFDGSALDGFVQMPPEVKAQFMEALNALKAGFEEAPQQKPEDILAKIDKILAKAEKTVTEQGGNILISYALNNVSAVQQFLYEVMNALELPEETKTEIKNQMNGALQPNVEDLSLKFDFTVNKETRTLAKISSSFTVKNKDSANLPVAVVMDVTFSDTEIGFRLVLDPVLQEELLVSLKKDVAGDTETYKISVDMTHGAVTVKMAELSVNYNEKTGEFTVALGLMDQQTAQMSTLTVKGKMTLTEKSFLFELTSLSDGFETLECKVGAEWNLEAVMPQFPAAKDVVALDEAGVEELLNSIDQSPFFALISSLMQQIAPQPDPNPQP